VETELTVSQRLNAVLLNPGLLREGDSASAGLLVTNLDASPRDLSVSLETSASALLIDGPSVQNLRVPGGGTATLYFNLAALGEGSADLRFSLEAGDFSEALSTSVRVEAARISETVSSTGMLDAGSSVTESLVLPATEEASLSLSLDSSFLSLAETAIGLLEESPYSDNLEQLSAALLSKLLFKPYLAELGFEDNTVAELESLASLQAEDGSFPYSIRDGGGDYYVSLRMAHIAALAQTYRMALPLDIASLCNYLEWGLIGDSPFSRPRSDYLRANALYVLSLLQAAGLYQSSLLTDRLSSLEQSFTSTTTNAAVLLTALAWEALGNTDRVAAISQRIRNLLRFTTRGVDITEAAGASTGIYYGGRLEQLALALQFYAGAKSADGAALAPELETRILFSLLEANRAGDSGVQPLWRSSAVTVRLLNALSDLLSASTTEVSLEAEAGLEGTVLLQGAFEGLDAKPLRAVFAAGEGPLKGLPRDEPLDLTFSAEGRGSLYYTASLEYAYSRFFPEAREEGLTVYAELLDADGTVISPVDSLYRLDSAATYRLRVLVSSTMDRNYLSLRVPVPSGSEILNSAFVSTATVRYEVEDRAYRQPDRTNIMQNEVQYSWDSFGKGVAEVNVLFRPLRTGVYPTPPASAECIYEKEIFGRSGGLLYMVQ
jgi:uncharacterized protein YfaS (alpha-2-macroglobulin family)